MADCIVRTTVVGAVASAGGTACRTTSRSGASPEKAYGIAGAGNGGDGLPGYPFGIYAICVLVRLDCGGSQALPHWPRSHAVPERRVRAPASSLAAPVSAALARIIQIVYLSLRAVTTRQVSVS